MNKYSFILSALTLPSFVPLCDDRIGPAMDPTDLPNYAKELRALEPIERPEAQLPELPRELWMEIIGTTVATPLTNPDFLVSCVFHK